MNELIKIEKTENGLTVSSRVIATELEKEHKAVLRDCRDNLLEGTDFTPSEYLTFQNKNVIEYQLTKNGFILLVMNYQGHNEFKRKYIERFDEMEKQLKETIKVPSTFKEALLLAYQQQEKI